MKIYMGLFDWLFLSFKQAVIKQGYFNSYCLFLYLRKGLKLIVLVSGFFLMAPNVTWADDSATDDSWRFQVKPLYLWFVSIDGSATIDPNNTSKGGTSNFDEAELTAAFSFHFEAGKGKWTLFTDYLFAEYTADDVAISSSPITGTNTLTTHIAELGATYRVLEHQRFRFELLGGVRYLYVSNKFDFNGDTLSTQSADTDLWDGFGGIRLTGFITESITATVRADVGGGTSDLVWNLIAIADWRYKNWGSVYAGYRVLDYQFNESVLDLNLQGKGPVAGLGFYW